MAVENKIRAIRKQKGITQVQMAQDLRITNRIHSGLVYQCSIINWAHDKGLYVHSGGNIVYLSHARILWIRHWCSCSQEDLRKHS
ncbi:hypothetical protein CHH52_16790 [Shouchella clausii]|nr:hypothetical protein CHH52_16790 [Shouchella clausii]